MISAERGRQSRRAARLPVDFVTALLNQNDKGVTGVYACWHMFEEKREAVLAIESAVAHSLSTGRSAPIGVPV
jgi:hypothetical protein